MLLYWLRTRRRRKLAEQPFPAEWGAYLRANMGYYGALDEREHERLHALVQVFVAEKHWEGCGGLELDDEIRVTIAGQACLLILELDHDLYRGIETILVYPSSVIPRRGFLAFGSYSGHPTPVAVVGQAFTRGPIILSWDTALHGGMHPHDGQNVVYHEFAHKLDMLDGGADGIPPLPNHEAARRWFLVFEREHEALRARVERGHKTFLGAYAATDIAEFFAVATERFFEQPRALKRAHPEVYELLQGFYQQDPDARATGR